MECLSSSVSIFGNSTQGSIPHNADSELFNATILGVLVNKSSSNWISVGVAFDVASHSRLDLAMQYISKLLRKHPCWVDINIMHLQAHTYTESEYQGCKRLLNIFQDELKETVSCFQQKYSMVPIDLMNMVYNYILIFATDVVLDHCVFGTDLFSSCNFLYRFFCPSATIVWSTLDIVSYKITLASTPHKNKEDLIFAFSVLFLNYF